MRMELTMRRRRAAIGSALFFLVAPGVVVGAVPWWITRWELRPSPMAVRVLGGLLLVVTLPVLVSAFVRFARDGLGTPAPVAPTERLVVSGAYRYVRNPMHLRSARGRGAGGAEGAVRHLRSRAPSGRSPVSFRCIESR